MTMGQFLPAEELPAAGSVDEARKPLAADKEIALEAVQLAGEEELANRKVAAC
jgi:hypothetical protein